MDPSERWQRAKEILYSALEMDAAERSLFLDEKCGTDQELRREIESLLAASESGGRLESPAVEVLAEVVSGKRTDEMIGRSLAHYRVLEKIGSGGMGEVYLAQDTRLERKVALKLLPPHFTREGDRVRRFQREARAASALNHPNILTIYEVGNVGETHFLSTEYVDGETLRTRVGRGPLKLRETLDVATQVASGLAAAHEAGIVHRDIKPENIMVRRDGIVKVLDFGLAKLTERPTAAADAPTMPNTGEGVVMGTVQYMSPEQARALAVDARSDIWSLGCVIYEMLTGRPPFSGETPSDVIVSILEREPPPVSRYAADPPAELDWLLKKSFRKDRDERYQTVKGLWSDLRALKSRFEFEAELERSQSPPLESGPVAVRASGRHSLGSETISQKLPQPTSSAEYIVGQIKQRKRGLIAASLIFASAALGAAGFWTYSRSGAPAPSTSVQTTAPLQTMKIARLTNTGRAQHAAISPDGRYVAYVASIEGRQSLRVRQVNANSDLQILPPDEVSFSGLTFSRDNDFIYYVASETRNPLSTLHKVPVLGGSSRRLISNVGNAVAFSPDGGQIAFIRYFPERGEYHLMAADADGARERRIATRKFPNFFSSVSWSPDGKTLACGAGSHVPVYNSNVVEIPAEGGPEKPSAAPGWFFLGQTAWLSDGSGLILNGSEQNSSSFDSSQVWHLLRETGEVRRVTNDLNNYSGVSLTADSGRLVTVQSGTVANVWLAPNGEAGRATQVTSGISNREGRDGVAWTPDGRIVYVSKASGSDDIWIMNADGSGRVQLTSDSGINSHPAVSPDGRTIVFTSTRSGSPHIWRMDLDGANAKQLTSGSGENYPQFTPDGGQVVYTLFAGKPTLWRSTLR